MFNTGVGVGEGTVLWLEDGANAFVQSDNVEPCKRLLFARVMTCFVVEGDFLKLALSYEASELPGLWRVMSVWGEATQVGANVRPEVVKAVNGEQGGLL